jgi:allantoicase
MPAQQAMSNNLTDAGVAFSHLLDLANESVGASVLAASDEFFAEKENLIKAAEPVFIPDKYTDRGKWMDGWESRRKRQPGYDWVVIRLGVPGLIRGVVVDARYFTGNFPEHASLEACTAAVNARLEDLGGWTEIVPKSPLGGDTLNPFVVTSPRRFTHVRMNAFPDGGVARLRVYGQALPEWRQLGPEIDLAAAECGATVVISSDQHYGHPRNLIMPGSGRNMADGWETRRRRGPGHDWVILRLAAEGIIERVEVDTSHFEGNFPDSCSLELTTDVAMGSNSTPREDSWTQILPRTQLVANTRHLFGQELLASCAARFARFNIYPDGGVSRLRLFGRLTEDGRAEVNLAGFNAASHEQAVADLLRCCGSTTWAQAMAARRPYCTSTELEAAAEAAWNRCSHQDWLQAFAAHPRIGESVRGGWSAEEQSRAAGAGEETRRELEELDRRYFETFGYVYIVCATGKTAEQMLGILERRLENSPNDEIKHAAEQQQLITRLRLEKLLRE